MGMAIVSGSAGLVGASAVRYLASQGLDVIGIDNDMRKYFFGSEASTRWNRDLLERSVKNYRHVEADIRDRNTMDALFRDCGKEIVLIIHAAAQPSHDWAGREPHTDFAINTTGTINLLEATRRYCPEAIFIFMSTNKVYGDTPNRLPLLELDTRWELAPEHAYAADGIDESMNVDQCLHSLFGASKLAADVLVQEYARYFGLRTACFRAGCLTGPAHSGAELHGFLAYLVKCAIADAPYTVIGYKGKQVRDNLHVTDLVAALWEFFRAPRHGAVYNIGGGRFANCSVMEAIRATEFIIGRSMRQSYTHVGRVGDHIWWISNTKKFRTDYPAWEPRRGIHNIIEELTETLLSRLGRCSS